MWCLFFNWVEPSEGASEGDNYLQLSTITVYNYLHLPYNNNAINGWVQAFRVTGAFMGLVPLPALNLVVNSGDLPPDPIRVRGLRPRAPTGLAGAALPAAHLIASASLSAASSDRNRGARPPHPGLGRPGHSGPAAGWWSQYHHHDYQLLDSP
jgi:hypothetical protein